MMVKTFIREQELPALLDEVHDWEFELDAVRRDDRTLVFELTPDRGFAPEERNRHKRMLVHNVRNVHVKDTERIGFYSIVDVKYRAPERLVDIITDIPLTYKIEVDDLKIEVEDLLTPDPHTDPQTQI